MTLPPIIVSDRRLASSQSLSSCAGESEDGKHTRNWIQLVFAGRGAHAHTHTHELAHTRGQCKSIDGLKRGNIASPTHASTLLHIAGNFSLV